MHESSIVGLKADAMTAVGFEPTPFRTGALSQRLRPLGQTVLRCRIGMKAENQEVRDFGSEELGHETQIPQGCFVGCVGSCGCLVWRFRCSG